MYDSIAQLYRTTDPTTTHMELFDVGPSALIRWNHLHLHDLDGRGPCTVSCRHVTICRWIKITNLRQCHTTTVLR